MTSAPRTASRMSLVTTAPVRSISRGTRGAGPHSHSFAPILPRSGGLTGRPGCGGYPDDGDLEAGDLPLHLKDRVEIEQALGWMFVRAVPRVDDGAGDVAGEEQGCARCGVPDHEMFGFIASMFRAVSSSVSPFVTLEVLELKFTTSAERRFPAISNEVRSACWLRRRGSPRSSRAERGPS